MSRIRGKIIGRVGALATTGLLAGSAWAQGPVPLPPAGPMPPGMAGCPLTPREARRQKLLDTFVGRPQDFVEPPLGTYVFENFGMMRNKADAHRFTLYRSDFLAGTNVFSPVGSTRFNLMASRMNGWLGPVVIEWSPDEPGVAESRRAAVLATLQGAGLPIVAERVVIGPSPYPGTLGDDAAGYYGTMIQRDQRAPTSYSVPPTISNGASLGGGSQ